ncbi:hypothetical protein WDU94_014906 [Cyamophila willieti]
MLDELQKSLINTRVANRVAPQFPTFAVSTSTGDDDGSDADTSVSISGTGFGTGFGGFFNNLGGFDTKNLKNKTTVKTEIINGHKVTVKESTYVSDNDGFKSVIHLSEVDMGDSDSNDKPKTSTPKIDEEGGEDTEEKDNEDKPKEETSTSKSDEKPAEPAIPESPEVNTKTTTENNESDNDEDNETILNRWNNKRTTEKTINPDSEVEEIETLGKDSNNYYNYNTVDKLIAAKEDQLETDSVPLEEHWYHNEIDSQLPPLSRSKRQAPPRGASLHDDTRVNQLISQKQKSSGLYSIDPDAELLDENTFYEVEGRRPSNQQQVYYQQTNPAGNSVYDDNQQLARRPNYEPVYQRRPNTQVRPNGQQARPQQYNTPNQDDYQRVLPAQYSQDDYQRVSSSQYRDQRDDRYQRNLPVDNQRQEVINSYARGDLQRTLPVFK